MKTSVTFQSALFRPYLPDCAQVNPGVYGAELAFWLSRQLAGRGIATSYPNSEDWGWYLEYILEDGAEYLLCCANLSDQPDTWRCSLEPQARSLFRRARPPVELARPLIEALRAVLAEEPAIVNACWE